MEFLADILMISGAAAAALYCIVLSRRLQRFNSLEKGVGGAIAALSTQVDDMTRTLSLAQQSAEGANGSLEGLTDRAEDVARRLELLVASMHDLPTSETAGHEASIATSAPSKSSIEYSSGFRSSRHDPRSEAA